MKKFTANGDAIRLRRSQLECGSTQKEFAYKIGISERRLRNIERKNALVAASLADQIANVLKVQRDDIVFSSERPRLVPPPAPALSPQPQTGAFRGRQLIPRFDQDSAKAMESEDELFTIANHSDVIRSEVRVAFNGETSRFAEELISLIEDASWSRRERFSALDAGTTMSMRRRMRELLVLLKGNNIWVYGLSHNKHLPECNEVPERLGTDVEWHGIFVFGPPGEYGENSETVDVDNGQPWIIDWDKPTF